MLNESPCLRDRFFHWVNEGIEDRLSDVIDKKRIFLEKRIVQGIEKLSLGYDGTGNLPPPFNRKISIVEYSGAEPEDILNPGNCKVLLRTIQRLRDHNGENSEELRRLIDNASLHITKNHARLVSWMPTSFKSGTGSLSIGCMLNVEHFGISGQKITRPFFVNLAHGRIDNTSLTAEMNAQKGRMRLNSGIIHVDEVTARVIKSMDKVSQQKLKDLLFDPAHPAYAPDYVNGYLMESQWSPLEARKQGVVFPPELEKIKVKNGKITGRIRFSKDTTWVEHTLKHRKDLPLTVLNGLPGQKINKVAEHPFLGDNMKIKKAKAGDDGTIRIRTIPETFIFPDFLVED